MLLCYSHQHFRLAKIVSKLFKKAKKNAIHSAAVLRISFSALNAPLEFDDILGDLCLTHGTSNRKNFL